MTNVVAIRKDLLEDIARDIGNETNSVYDGLLRVCILFFEAKEVCKVRDIAFRKWVLEYTEYAPNKAYDYAKIGEAEDPAEALATYRRRRASAVAKSEAKKKLPSAEGEINEPRSKTYESNYEMAPAGSLEEEEPDEDDSYRRKRAFLNRAREAVDFAAWDNMDGIELTDDIVDTAKMVAQSWADLADKLETDYAKQIQ